MILRCFKYFCCFFIILITQSAFAGGALESTFAANVRQYEGSDQSELGLGLRFRYTRFSGPGWGYYVRAHFDEHGLAPVIIPAVAYRWGTSTFFEMGGGVYIGTLVRRNLALAIMPTLGFELTDKWFIAINFYYDTNLGSVYGTQFMPFIGYKF